MNEICPENILKAIRKALVEADSVVLIAQERANGIREGAAKMARELVGLGEKDSINLDSGEITRVPKEVTE